MARELSAVLTIICIFMHLNSAIVDGATLKCHKLKQVFPMCDCRAATEEKGAIYAIVDCSGKNLEQVPTIIGSYDQPFYKLILKNNKITTLTDSSFQGLKIEYLDLSGNKLVSVDNDTFLSMKDNLETLEIDGDGQSLPPVHALKKLNRIQTLTMRQYNVPVLEKHHNFFLSFTYLKILTLDNWNIGHIEGSSFLGLDRLESLTLLNQKLENLPLDGLRDEPFKNLETLRISGNQIKRVTDFAFSHLEKLKTLDLSDNKIELLESDCFNKVGNTLQNVNLKGNALNNDVGKLDGLKNMAALERLDISFNTFQKIPSMLNLGVTKPLHLLLDNNAINLVPENSFQGYSQYLNDLDLSKNYIRKMHYLSFKGVTGLVAINLEYQKGVDNSPLELPISLTNSGSTLQTMNLSGQKVDPNSLWTVVKELTALKKLSLASAELQSIPDNTFEKVHALEHIDLQYNSLTTISQNSLAGARQLKRLDLEGNGITTVPSCLFYGFLSPKITLLIGLNPIVCDCRVKKLLEDYKGGRIIFDSTRQSPKCKNGMLLKDVNPDTLKCTPPITEEPCVEHYTTTTTPMTTESVTDQSPPQLHLSIVDVGIHTIKVSWSLSHRTGLSDFKFQVTSANSVEEFTRDNIETSVSTLEAHGLQANTHFTVCVIASFDNRPNVQNCSLSKTRPSTTPDKEDLEDDSTDSASTAIIVGCVVAGVALIGVVIAIIILLVFRKKPKEVPGNYRPPTQPRNFAKAELPSMSDDSRTFAKPKKNGKGPQKENMQVVAISDGQTSPGPRVGRVNMMFKPEDGYEPMSNFKKQNGGSMYENDHGALPPTPGPDQDSRPPSYPGATGGYYNQGYNEDKYDEIEVEI